MKSVYSEYTKNHIDKHIESHNKPQACASYQEDNNVLFMNIVNHNGQLIHVK